MNTKPTAIERVKMYPGDAVIGGAVGALAGYVIIKHFINAKHKPIVIAGTLGVAVIGIMISTANKHKIVLANQPIVQNK